MSYFTEQMKERLKAKLDSFENMETLLRKQGKRLEENDYSGFDQLCGHVDKIVIELKNIDYETAILESSVDSKSRLEDSLHDQDLMKLLHNVRGKAEQNMELLNKLASILTESKAKLRGELDNTVAMGNISGYRPYERNVPMYFDKRN